MLVNERAAVAAAVPGPRGTAGCHSSPPPGGWAEPWAAGPTLVALAVKGCHSLQCEFSHMR